MSHKESGYAGRLYSLSGLGDSGGRGRESRKDLQVVPITDVIIMGNNPLRIWALIVNIGTKDCYLNLSEDEPAILGFGIPLVAAGGWVLINDDLAWTGIIHAIIDGTGADYTDLTIMEVSLQSTTPEPIPPTGGNGGNGGNGGSIRGKC
jgi:hypothetical protein